MELYYFTQRNVGGSYDITSDLSQDVIIEAESCEEANEIAESLGIYFNGVEEGYDCGCCGDRWSPAEPHYTVEDLEKYINERLQYKRIVTVHYADGLTIRHQ